MRIWQIPENVAKPQEAAKAERSSWEQNIWEYTHRLYKECHVLYKSPLVIYTWPQGSPGHSSALRIHLELFASQDLLIKQFSLSGKKNREVFKLKQGVIVQITPPGEIKFAVLE